MFCSWQNIRTYSKIINKISKSLMMDRRCTIHQVSHCVQPSIKIGLGYPGRTFLRVCSPCAQRMNPYTGFISSRCFSVNAQESPKSTAATSATDEKKGTTTESSKNQNTGAGAAGAGMSKRALQLTLLFMGVWGIGTLGYMIAVWGAPELDENGNEIEDEFSPLPKWEQHLRRTKKTVLFYNKMIQDPSREALLPDPLTDPFYQPPYTLVIEMTGILVHPDWTYKTGWRFKKRPGVDLFLQQVATPLYEIVVYTSEQGFTAYPILDSLDPNGFITYKLFRDATRYVNGHHVKDLSCLNRDLSKVVIVDWNDKSFQLQPENAIKLRKWTGNDDDRTLVDLAVFLKTLAANEVEDVRPVLKFYKQYEDPLNAFKEKQRVIEEEHLRAIAQQKLTDVEGAKNLASSWSRSFGRR